MHLTDKTNLFNMKKTIFSILFIVTFAIYTTHEKNYSFYIHKKSLDILPTLPMTEIKSGSRYKDGQYVGSVADAYYGNIQLGVTILDGHISNIIFLEYPKERQNSARLNQDALPKLRTETIVAQNANVDAVTGASLTSAAYIESLSSALTQAKTLYEAD